MSSKEIDEAMRLKKPVKHNGIRYDYIAEYVLWYDIHGKRRLSLGLVSGGTLMRVPADTVEVAE